MTIDVGTGDGRAVVATAIAEPTWLAIGLDAVATSMAEAARRTARAPGRGGLPNALFVVAAAEDPPTELVGLATRVTVNMPWGSLLRGCLGSDDLVARGLARLMAPGGSLELLIAPSPRDRIERLPSTVDGVRAGVTSAFAPHRLEVADCRAATAEEVLATGSTWARRLLARGTVDRAAIRVGLRLRS